MNGEIPLNNKNKNIKSMFLILYVINLIGVFLFYNKIKTIRDPNYLYFQSNKTVIEEKIKSKFMSNYNIYNHKVKGVFVEKNNSIHEMVVSNKNVEFKKITNSKLETFWFFNRTNITILISGLIIMFIVFSVIPNILRGYNDWWKFW